MANAQNLVPNADPRSDWEGEVFETMFPVKSTLDIDSCSVTVGEETGKANAASIFLRKGFVILRGALSADQVDELQETCKKLYGSVGRLDPEGQGNRNPGRYSFGAITPSGQCLHLRAFLHLLQVDFIHEILGQIYQVNVNSKGPVISGTESGYLVHAAGGDFCTGPKQVHEVVGFNCEAGL